MEADSEEDEISGSATSSDAKPEEPFLGRKEGQEITTGVLTTVFGVIVLGILAWVGGQLLSDGGAPEKGDTSENSASEATESGGADDAAGATDAPSDDLSAEQDERLEVNLPYSFTYTDMRVTLDKVECADAQEERECRLMMSVRNDGNTRQGLPSGSFEIFIADDHYFGLDRSDYLFPGEQGTAEVVFEVPLGASPSRVEVDFYDTLGDEDPMSLVVIL
jgi:hypothetical protein